MTSQWFNADQESGHTNIFHETQHGKHKRYQSVKTGTRFYVDFWTEGVYMMPQNGGAAFNLSQAQFDTWIANGSYKEGWT